MFEISKLKPAVRVLAEDVARSGEDGAKLPLICLQYAGAGKVLFHAIDGTWRWRYRVGDVFFARYWVQTIRYLSRAKLLGKDRSAELATDRREYRRGENVLVRARFTDERLAPAEDDGVSVVLEQQEGKNLRLQLQRAELGRGVFEASLSDLPEGRYHAWIAAPTLEGARRRPTSWSQWPPAKSSASRPILPSWRAPAIRPRDAPSLWPRPGS